MVNSMMTENVVCMNFELESKYGVQGLCDKMQDGLEVPLSVVSLVTESVKQYYGVDLVQRDGVIQRREGIWNGQPHDGQFVTLVDAKLVAYHGA